MEGKEKAGEFQKQGTFTLSLVPGNRCNGIPTSISAMPFNQKPQERMTSLTNALKINNYDAEPLLQSCGITINRNFTSIDGRVLAAPRKLVDPAKIEHRAIVNFSARCDLNGLVRDITKCAEMKGIPIEPPFDVFEENTQFRRAPPLVSVEKMFEDILQASWGS